MMVVALITLRGGHAETPPQTYYVSPAGNSANPGSIDKPWDLTSALSKSSVVKPGDTIYLRDGVYGSGGTTTFTSSLNGTKDKPIVVRGFPKERATVNGHITVNGKFNWYWGFEITNSMTERHVASKDRLGGLELYGEGTKVINMVLHDTGHPAIGFWRPVGDGGEIYGTLIWGAGIYDTSPQYKGEMRGSPIYAQNQTGQRLISDNITFRNLTTAMKAYATNSWANGFTFDGNIALQATDNLGLFVESQDNPIDKLVLSNNYIYLGPDKNGTGFTAGLFNPKHGEIIAQNNYIGLTNGVGYNIKNWDKVTVTNNTVVAKKGSALRIDNATPMSQFNIDRNTYIVGAARPFQDTELQQRLDAVWACDFTSSTQTIKDYTQGRSGGPVNSCPGASVAGSRYDRNSVITSDMSQATNRVFVRANKYEPGRANIAVYNWENRPSVSADLSSILKPGQSYVVLDAQNYYGKPIASGVYKGGVITLPMNLTEVAPLIGSVPEIPNTHTAPEFAAFVVLPQEGVAPNSNPNTQRPGQVSYATASTAASSNQTAAPISISSNSGKSEDKTNDLSDISKLASPTSQNKSLLVRYSETVKSIVRKYPILVGAIMLGLIAIISGAIWWLMRRRSVTQNTSNYPTNTATDDELVPPTDPPKV